MKPGDIVRLKSGSPRMTVERVKETAIMDNPIPNVIVECVWFSGDAPICRAFVKDALESDP